MRLLHVIITTLFILTVKSTEPKTVHLIFMNHLDVGFNGISPTVGFVNNILNRYFTVYFPRAALLALQLEYSGYVERLVYTTHPWLVYLYINCPSQMELSGIKLACPNATSLADFKMAVNKGYITWHAGAMNLQPEVASPELFDFSLRLSDDLDKHFNITRKTKVMSQRDVPGMTKAVIPILVKNNIKAVSVGVNGVTSPPAVPNLFNWVFKNQSIIGFWHPGGYPNKPGQIPLMPYGLSRKDCLVHPLVPSALCFAFRNDNAGPPETIQEILNYYEVVRSQFPNSFVRGSKFDDFVSDVLPVKAHLPKITQEIGDTWIEGIASDPGKVSRMRTFMKLWSECLRRNGCSLSDSRIYQSGLYLLKTTEHTWGINGAKDTRNWNNEDFTKVRHQSNIQNCEKSWKEQRKFLELAMTALGKHPLAQKIKDKWNDLKTQWPDTSEYKQDKLPGQFRLGNGNEIGFNKEGHVNRLILPYYNISVISEDGVFGRFVYQTLNQSDFDVFTKEYSYSNAFFLGIGKPNMTKNTEARSQVWPTKVVAFYRKPDNNSFLIHWKMQNPATHEYYGAPTDIWLNYTQILKNEWNVELQWFNKSTTRLPESLSLVMLNPDKTRLRTCLHKMGQLLAADNVLTNGSQSLHAVDRGMYFMGRSGGLFEIRTADAPLVNLFSSRHTQPPPVPMKLKPLPQIEGFYFNLYNNVWEVNYIYWYPFVEEDRNQKFRFQIAVHADHGEKTMDDSCH